MTVNETKGRELEALPRVITESRGELLKIINKSSS